MLCTSKITQNHVTYVQPPLLFHTSNFWSLNKKLRSQTGSHGSDWECINLRTHRGSLKVSIQEHCYTLKTCWYRTPDRIHKINPNIPPNCWRCGLEIGSFIHISWVCLKISPYWESVQRTIAEFSTESLDLTPAQFLPHHNNLSDFRYIRLVMTLNAAKNVYNYTGRCHQFPPLINGSFI